MAYVILQTDNPAGLEGHGLTFTIGRGNEVCVAAINALKHRVVGQSLESFTANMAAFWRTLTGDSQLRWIGPEKGAMHMATAAVANAVWDLYAKVEGKPLWRLLSLTPNATVRHPRRRVLFSLLRAVAESGIRSRSTKRHRASSQTVRTRYGRLH